MRGMRGLKTRSRPGVRSDGNMTKRAKGCVRGIVQGVGFRPFIYQLARRYHFAGFVSNTAQGVDVEVEGAAPDLPRFFEGDTISDENPPLRGGIGAGHESRGRSQSHGTGTSHD